MITLFKLNLMLLILFMKYDELNSKSIVGNRKDSGLYDKVSDVSTFNNNKFSNLNSQYKLLSTDGNLEQSIMPAEVIELTTPIASKINLNSATDAEENILHVNDMQRLLFNFNGDDGKSCLLDDIKMSLRWWTFPNGTLTVSNMKIMPIMHNVDLSFSNISRDQQLYDHITSLENQQIIVFSAAYNYLNTVPQHTLEFIGNSLKYLTLTGNRFVAQAEEETPDDLKSRINNGTHHYNGTENDYHCKLNNESVNIGIPTDNKKERIFSKKGNGIAWATFPYLRNLIELDISNCQIEFVTRLAFRNLTNLRRLYISHNKMLTIPFNSFYDIPSLEYLDLSFTNVLDYNDKIPLPSLDAIYNLIYGVHIEALTFENLRKLVYLDLSHTKLTRNSALAFIHLGDQLKYLSLCYTAFPMLGNAMFKNTALRGIDLSGNSFTAYKILEDAFEGVSNTLKFMYFENSNLKDLAWLKYLKNVSFLGLAGNNINSLSVDIFSTMRSLEVLDLSSNQVGNWYKRVFANNENLRVLSLRENNLNIITNEMLKDFSLLNYLSLGDNDFVCDCLLREIRDVAQINNNEAKCTRNFIEKTTKTIRTTMKNKTKSIWNNQLGQIDVPLLLWKQQFKKLKNLKRKNIKISKKKLKMRFLSNYSDQCLTTESSSSTKTIGKLNGTVFKFQLLDYEEDHYWCFNETEKMNFFQLNCQPQNFVEDIARQLKTLCTYILVCVGSLIGISVIGFIIYWKRWYIHYYYTTLKTASLMSEAAKDYHNKINTLSNEDPNLVYDIFISYCQTDRDWILQELIPNVEETEDISICLHERDFQIGVTIIDNIVSCMERSRALMLVISSDFLLSHWCQFEMQLAQHRIFDISKEHLILVFLEDIPKTKRPKHLQYLMDIKTYIKWPGGKSKKSARVEDRKLFWKRLKRSLSSIGFSPTESKA